MRPLRALLRFAGLTIVSVTCFLLLAPRLLLNPLGRRAAAMRWAARVQRWWGRGCLAACGVRVEGGGTPHLGPALIAANHLSYLDIFLLASLQPVRFVAKSEIAGWPVMGRLSRGAGTLFIRQAERRDVRRIGDLMEETLRAGVSVVLFPEGKATRGERVEKLHSPLFAGAVRHGIPCVVRAISYSTPRDRWGEAWTVAWWGGMKLPGHLWRLLHLHSIHARVGSRLVLTAGEDRKLVAAEVHRILAAEFVPLRQEPRPPGVVVPDAAEAESVAS